MPSDKVVGVFDHWSRKYWCWDCFPQSGWRLPGATLMFSRLYEDEHDVYGEKEKCCKCGKHIYKQGVVNA